MARLLVLALLGWLAACAPDPTAQAPVPTLPAGYDPQRAGLLAEQGWAAVQADRPAEAQALFEQALVAWPAAEPAWAGLATARAARGQTAAAERAAFFADRVAFLDDMSPAGAAAALDPLVAGQGAGQDPEIQRTATALRDFYRDVDSVAWGERLAARGENLSEDYRLAYYTAMVATGIIVSVYFGAQFLGGG